MPSITWGIINRTIQLFLMIQLKVKPGRPPLARPSAGCNPHPMQCWLVYTLFSKLFHSSDYLPQTDPNRWILNFAHPLAEILKKSPVSALPNETRRTEKTSGFKVADLTRESSHFSLHCETNELNEVEGIDS